MTRTGYSVIRTWYFVREEGAVMLLIIRAHKMAPHNYTFMYNYVR